MTPSPSCSVSTSAKGTLFGDCYDYDAAVLFNANAADLRRRFTTYLPRYFARLQRVEQAAHPRRGDRRPARRPGIQASSSTP